MTKKGFTLDWFTIFVLVFIVLLWQLGIFKGIFTPYPHHTYSFAKIKPFVSACHLTPDGIYTGVFINGVGIPITVEKIVLINDKTGDVLCESQFSPKTVKPGESFNVEVFGCGSGRPGGVYDIRVNIDYKLTVNDSVHNESGVYRDVRESKIMGIWQNDLIEKLRYTVPPVFLAVGVVIILLLRLKLKENEKIRKHSLIFSILTAVILIAYFLICCKLTSYTFYDFIYQLG